MSVDGKVFSHYSGKFRYHVEEGYDQYQEGYEITVNKISAYERYCEAAHVNGSADYLVFGKTWLDWLMFCLGYNWQDFG